MSSSLAVSVAPIFLRLVLGVTFVWAGAIKVFGEREYTGSAAAQLAEWGHAHSGSASKTPAVEKSPASSTEPPVNPPSAGVPDAAPPAPTSEVGTVQARRLFDIALMIKSMATPTVRADGTTGMTLVPAKAADGQTPVMLAWGAAITELAGGVAILIGLFTRLCALAIAVVMGVAMWLTQIGPAVAGGGALLGFLPRHDAFDIAAWQPLLWQFSLLGAALALLFAGAGAISLDSLFVVRRGSAARKVVVEPAAP